METVNTGKENHGVRGEKGLKRGEGERRQRTFSGKIVGSFSWSGRVPSLFKVRTFRRDFRSLGLPEVWCFGFAYLVREREGELFCLYTRLILQISSYFSVDAMSCIGWESGPCWVPNTYCLIAEPFTLQIVPQLQAGKNVMIAAHGNSLRSIIMYLDKLTSQEVSELFSLNSTLGQFLALIIFFFLFCTANLVSLLNLLPFFTYFNRWSV